MPPAPAPARARLWEWLPAGLLGANLAWTTLCLGGFLASTAAVTWALAGATLVVVLLGRAFGPHAATPLHPATWWPLPFLVYAALNAAWVSPVPWLGWQDWFNWALLTATFCAVLNGVRARGPRNFVAGTLGALAIVAVAFACYQRFVRPDWLIILGRQLPQFAERASGPFGIPNSLAAFLILLLPVALALTLRRGADAFERVLFGWVTLVMALGLALTISRGGWIALLLALVAWPLFIAAWHWRRRALVCGGVLLAAWLGAVGLLQLSPKVRARYEATLRESGELKRPIMWRAAWLTFRAQPWLGSGAGSYNVMFERHRPEREQGDPKWAHNDYLNTLSDYGLVGAALWLGAGGALAWRGLRGRRDASSSNGDAGKGRRTLRQAFDDPLVQQGLAVGLGAFLVQLVFDFHFKIPALAMAFATTGGLWLARAWPAPAREARALAPMPAPPRFSFIAVAAIVAAVAAGAVVAFWIVPAFRAEGIREWSRRDLDRLTKVDDSAERLAVALAARVRLTRALAIDSSNPQAWADRAYALAVIAHEQPARDAELGPLAEADARRALASGPLVAEFWYRLGVALDMQHRWVEAGGAFSKGLELAPRTSQAWFYQAYHLSLNPITHRLAGAAVETCLRLDPGNREGENLRRQLALRPK